MNILKAVNLEELENLPKKESRKAYLTRKYGDMWDLPKFDHPWMRSDKSDYPYIIAERVIKKFLGKSFDKAFSYFCKLVPKHEQNEFLRKFKPRYRWEPDYIIDNQKRIQLNPNRYTRPKRPIYFRSFDYEEGYYNIVTKEIIQASRRWEYKDDIHIRVIVKGFEKIFESKKDLEYQRLKAEKEKAIKRNERLLKEQKKNKQYCFLTDKELSEKDEDRKQNLRI